MDPSSIKPDSHGRVPENDRAAVDHAIRLILRVCRLVGPTAIVDDAGDSV
jgi:hypothetical protein